MTQIVGISLVITVLLVVLRQHAAPYGAAVAIGFVIVVFLWLLRPLSQVIETMGTLAQQAGVREAHLGTVLKAIGIAAVTSIGADLCRDAGEEAIGHMVELVGKVFILILALPVVAAIVEAIVGLLPG